MHREFFHYAIPFTFGRPARRLETPPPPRGGTCVAVQFSPGAQFLFTARHVMLPALDATASDGADCLAGNVRLVPEAATLSEETLDIATLRLSEARLSGLEADGYRVIRPAEWPGPAPAVHDPILLAGFPGAWRRQIAWNTLDVPGTTMLAMIHHLRDEEFVCQLDPAFVDRDVADYGEDVVQGDQLPSLSGGPALLVRREPIIVPHLCGILKQGTIIGGSRLLYFARVERVREDGSIRDG